MDRDRLKKDLARDEGKVLVSYQDTNQFWTVGVGHLVGKERRIFSITEEECDAFLEHDIDAAIKIVYASCPLVALATFAHDDVRWRALANMAFNRGGHMKTSSTITPAITAAIQSGEWAPVGAAIMASPWAKQIGERAARLSVMLVTGRDPA